ncbi:MAG: hypothetical protein JRJ03_13505 [Deltaproteobacteria bacterium]|nr:hypothetical protein [Deltaproteobacteria bacterium]
MPHIGLLHKSRERYHICDPRKIMRRLDRHTDWVGGTSISGLIVTHGGDSDTSCPTVTNGDLITLHYDRDLTDPLGVPEHLLKFFLVFLYVIVLGIFLVCLPGTLRIGSPALAKDNDFFCHDRPPTKG